jgi:prepilin-type N-terminal cleavage/methylation domain-containing protein
MAGLSPPRELPATGQYRTDGVERERLWRVHEAIDGQTVAARAPARESRPARFDVSQVEICFGGGHWSMAQSIHPFPGRRVRRGFTLIEALMASAILLGIVSAITTAIIAGQQHALAAQEQIAATLSADALMAQIMTDDYDNLPTWHLFREEPGAMVDEHGSPMPPIYDTIGREVHISASTRELDPPGVTVRGRVVTVTGFNSAGDTLIELERFVVEPQS